ncbi:MAG: hypothetical protein C4325_01425, partial [Blastocatellia bacterium]
MLKMRRMKALNQLVVLILLGFVAMPFANAQSQAMNGQIEGTVTDTNGAAVPSVSVRVVNVETGTERSALTDSNGVYRLPLLPLGTYRISF